MKLKTRVLIFLLLLIPHTAAAVAPSMPTKYMVDKNKPGIRLPLTAKPVDESLPAPELTEVWTPAPPKVQPAVKAGAPPSDAIVLFNGKDLSNWEAVLGGPARWRVVNDQMVVEPFSGDTETKESYGDCQLHVEWMTPAGLPPEKTGQDRGNSGVYLQGRYEIQILDSYSNITYANGQAGAIYKQFAPLVNASKPAGQWQSYDIIFMAPHFDEKGALTSPARVTVFQNGVLIQNAVSLKGATVFRGPPGYDVHGPAPLMLQDHHHEVRFRNIWLRRL